MMGPMSRFRRLSAGLVAALAIVAGACVDPPPSFRLVGLDEARELIGSGHVELVEAFSAEDRSHSVIPGGIRWRLSPGSPAEPPEIPAGPVLVVADRPPLGFRAAAALARTRNGEVYVIITDSAEERGTLYALEPQQEEIPRGRDS